MRRTALARPLAIPGLQTSAGSWRRSEEIQRLVKTSWLASQARRLYQGCAAVVQESIMS